MPGGPIDPAGTYLPDGRWWPAIGGHAMCDGERVHVLDIHVDPFGSVYDKVARIAWPKGLEETVPVGALSPAAPSQGGALGAGGALAAAWVIKTRWAESHLLASGPVEEFNGGRYGRTRCGRRVNLTGLQAEHGAIWRCPTCEHTTTGRSKR